jgi:hypothetical protein
MKVKVRTAENLRRLRTQYGEEIVSLTDVYDWCSKFFEGYEEVTSQAHTLS